jgi:transcriptional regulator with XRE-family HTH domain
LAKQAIFIYMKRMTQGLRRAARERRGPAATADAEIGGRIRARRRDAGLSLQEIARRTGYSIGYLSQVERGLSTASIKFLATLGDAFGIGLAGFLSPPTAANGGEVVVRKAMRGRLGLWRSGIAKELLTPPQGASALNLFTVHIEPKGSTGDEDYRHGGEEGGYVLEGVLELTVEGRTWRLEPGDSFRFESHRPHRFGNPTDEPTTVLWVNVAPR